MVLVCGQHHPRADELNDRQAIMRESFAAYLSSEVGIKNFHAHMKKFAGANDCLSQRFSDSDCQYD